MQQVTEVAQSTSAKVDFHATFTRQREASRRDNYPSLSVRLDRLDRLRAALESNEEALVEAMRQDFGHRAPVESRMFDITVPLGDLKDTRRHVAKWMQPRDVKTRLHLQPASSRILPQPLGVVGVISPWNFPVYLSIAPMAAALAAGNRVMLKPSELTPRTSNVLARALADVFEDDEVAVVTGGPEVGAEFATLPFDHLFFTGSTRVGRIVAKAAAENLTPVTLELGGKSPAIICPDEDLARAAEKIAYGKMMNAGQICVSPDYVLCPRGQEREVANAIRAAAIRFYPSIQDNDDYTSIVSQRHRDRLWKLLDEARADGAEIIEVNPSDEPPDPDAIKIPLHLVLGASLESRLMSEEIFGPLLPILPYDSLDDAIEFVNERDRPLALYVFGRDESERERVLRGTVSGGVTVNDVAWHVVNDPLPFGGVGASGMGAYHGKWGFETFSKLKPILHQPDVNAIPLFYPPYGRVMGFLTRHFRRFL